MSHPTARCMRTCGSLLVLAAALSTPREAHASVHRMFVTSATGNGNLHAWSQANGKYGLAAGDQICQALADAVPALAGATFRAWLSSASTDAFCHVAGFSGKVSDSNPCGQASLPNAGPWVRVDGKPFSRKLQALTDVTTSRVLYPPMPDEKGNTWPYSLVYTGTLQSGVAATSGSVVLDCDDGSGAWRSGSASDEAHFGLTHSGVRWWTDATTAGCDEIGRLLCFEEGVGDALPSFGTPGAYAFVTSQLGTGKLSTWPQAGNNTGLAAGDAICRALATSAGYPDPSSFVAWLSASGATPAAAADRVVGPGPWRRPGGVQIAADRASLLEASVPWLASDIEIDNLGVHAVGNVFTGTDSTGQPSGEDCNGWTSDLASSSATQGFRQSAAYWTDTGTVAQCDRLQSLYCFSSVVEIVVDGFESGDTSAWDDATP